MSIIDLFRYLRIISILFLSSRRIEIIKWLPRSPDWLSWTYLPKEHLLIKRLKKSVKENYAKWKKSDRKFEENRLKMNGGSHIYFDHGTFESERQTAEQKRRQQLRFKTWPLNNDFNRLFHSYLYNNNSGLRYDH